MTRDAGFGAGTFPRLDGMTEQLRQELRGGAFVHRRFPCVTDLAEDLALADDHRVEAGCNGEEVRHRRVVVVRVEVLGQLVERSARVRREELGDVTDRGMEARAAGVDLRSVARREHDDLEQVLASGEIVQHLRQDRLANGHPFEQLDRDRAVVQTDDDERHVLNSSFAAST